MSPWNAGSYENEMKIGSCKNVIIFTAMMLMIMYIFKMKMITMCMQESQWEV